MALPPRLLTFLSLVSFVQSFALIFDRNDHVIQGRLIPYTDRRHHYTGRRVLSYPTGDAVRTPFPLSASIDDSTDGDPPTTRLNPSWRSIFEVPINVETQQQFDSIPLAKRIAIVSRVSVLHLTILSCLGPLILRGALRSALPASEWASVPLTPIMASLFALDGLSWHAVHNLLNDWQDLDDDDSVEDSFRLAYGCHALHQGFLTKSKFLRLMAFVGFPGAVLTFAFRNTVLAPAAFYGIIALFFYTIVFKPLAMGEILIYFVWGPLMAGFG